MSHAVPSRFYTKPGSYRVEFRHRIPVGTQELRLNGKIVATCKIGEPHSEDFDVVRFSPADRWIAP